MKHMVSFTIFSIDKMCLIFISDWNKDSNHVTVCFRVDIIQPKTGTGLAVVIVSDKSWHSWICCISVYVIDIFFSYARYLHGYDNDAAHGGGGGRFECFDEPPPPPNW